MMTQRLSNINTKERIHILKSPTFKKGSLVTAIVGYIYNKAALVRNPYGWNVPSGAESRTVRSRGQNNRSIRQSPSFP